MKMNRWHRIGVVVSCLWMLFAAINVRTKQVKEAQASLDIAYQLCMNREGYADCLSRAQDRFHEAFSLDAYAVMEIATAMVLPVVFFWPLAWIIVKVYRWVMAG